MGVMFDRVRGGGCGLLPIIACGKRNPLNENYADALAKVVQTVWKRARAGTLVRLIGGRAQRSAGDLPRQLDVIAQRFPP